MTDDIDFLHIPPKPRNWGELFAITGGLQGTPIEEIVLGHPIHEYEFDSKDMRPCGRKNCERLHAHGWLVALTNGRFVHIGQDCASKYTAGAHVWNQKVSAYRGREEARIRKQAFVQIRLEAQEKQYWLDNTPAIDLAIALHRSFCDQANGPLLHEVEQRAERGRSVIEREFRLTEVERELRRAALEAGRTSDEPRAYVAQVETRTVASLIGLECFHPKNTPFVLKQELQQLVTTLLSWQPADDDRDAIRSMQRAKRDLAPLSNRLNTSLIAVEKFFTEANFKSLMNLTVVRAQGIISIERSGTIVRISRRAHWGRVA
ncbi:hypothetical protein [Lysobacter enzymogenes]|uniref:hypothetical protein n=1 Tax=Lysobacter enzymogenes TaxID=69 RepID=UPI000F4B2238|nr:hypothetical protein [Lysobacter enzymogenes]